MPPCTVRAAKPSDVPTLLRFIRELAAYERALHEVHATEADLLRDGWSLSPNLEPLPHPTPPRFHALLAELPGGDGESLISAGFALYFVSYSTWLGHHGLRLEDLYVTPASRHQGIGKALLAHLARIALREGCSRLEWDVLTWNQPALDVYRALGATTKDDWHVMRLTGDALIQLAGLAQPPAASM